MPPPDRSPTVPVTMKHLIAIVEVTTIAQFLAVCRRSKVVALSTRRPRSGARLCRRCALPRRGETPRLRQIVCATKCEKLSVWCRAGREGGPHARDRPRRSLLLAILCPLFPRLCTSPVHATYDGKLKHLPRAFQCSTPLLLRYNSTMDIV